MNQRLIFEIKPGVSQDLRIGELRLIDDGAVYRWKATSGIPKRQSESHCWTRNSGLIPASNIVREPYKVLTAMSFSTNVSAVGKWLFAILPFNVWGKSGDRKRTNLAIHLDANHATSPGSGGCIVFLDSVSFDAFSEHMKRINDSNVYELPLEVIYS